MSNDMYIGLLDVHQISAATVVHIHQGECVMKSIIETKAQTIRDFINQSKALSAWYLRKALQQLGFMI